MSVPLFHCCPWPRPLSSRLTSLRSESRGLPLHPCTVPTSPSSSILLIIAEEEVKLPPRPYDLEVQEGFLGVFFNDTDEPLCSSLPTQDLFFFLFSMATEKDHRKKQGIPEWYWPVSTDNSHREKERVGGGRGKRAETQFRLTLGCVQHLFILLMNSQINVFATLTPITLSKFHLTRSETLMMCCQHRFTTLPCSVTSWYCIMWEIPLCSRSDGGSRRQITVEQKSLNKCIPSFP